MTALKDNIKKNVKSKIEDIKRKMNRGSSNDVGGSSSPSRKMSTKNFGDDDEGNLSKPNTSIKEDPDENKDSEHLGSSASDQESEVEFEQVHIDQETTPNTLLQNMASLGDVETTMETPGAMKFLEGSNDLSSLTSPRQSEAVTPYAGSGGVPSAQLETLNMTIKMMKKDIREDKKTTAQLIQTQSKKLESEIKK